MRKFFNSKVVNQEISASECCRIEHQTFLKKFFVVKYAMPSNSYGAPTNQKISEPSLGTRYYDGVEDVPHFSYE